MVAVQAAGCAPIARAFESGAKEVREWEHPVETAASSIADPLRGYPEDGTRTLSVVRESGGEAVAVSEEETRRATIELARSDRKSTRLNSSHANISYAVFCLKKKK